VSLNFTLNARHTSCPEKQKKIGLIAKLTNYHCKYIAYNLTRKAVNGQERLSLSLFNAAVDLNPHQIEAALFALQSPLSLGSILADEVGLGKTIEAGIVLCQYWAERHRKILIITPASIRKQWALELEKKFNLIIMRNSQKLLYRWMQGMAQALLRQLRYVD